MRRLALAGLALCLVCGCDSVDLVGQRYRAEREYWQAQRQLSDLEGRPAGVKTAEVERVRAEFLAVVARAGGVHATDPYLRILLGRCLLQSYDLQVTEGKAADAAVALNTILQDFPNDTLIQGEALWRRAQRRANSGDSAEAVEDYREIVRLVRPVVSNSTSVQGQVMGLPLALAQYQIAHASPRAAEETARAESYYRHLAASDPKGPEAFAARAYLGDLFQAAGRVDAALSVLDSLQQDCHKVPEEDERRPDLLLRLAAIAADGAGDIRRAHGFLDLLARDHPDSPLRGRAQLMRARLFVLAHRNADAESALRKAAEDGSLSEAVRATAWVEIARLMERQNNRDEARRSYREAATNFPLTPQGMRAPLYQLQGCLTLKDAAGAQAAAKEAQKYYQDLLTRYGEAPLAGDMRWLLVQADLYLQDWKSAETALNGIIGHPTGTSNDLRAMQMLAQIHEEKMQLPKVAAEDYRKILARYPDAPFREDLQARIRKLGG